MAQEARCEKPRRRCGFRAAQNSYCLTCIPVGLLPAGFRRPRRVKENLVGTVKLIRLNLQDHTLCFSRCRPAIRAARFFCVASELKPQIGSPAVEKRIDEINQALLTRVEKSGEAFLSIAVVNGKFALRACILNFRTSLVDIEALLPLLSRLGENICRESVLRAGISPARRT